MTLRIPLARFGAISPNKRKSAEILKLVVEFFGEGEGGGPISFDNISVDLQQIQVGLLGNENFIHLMAKY